MPTRARAREIVKARALKRGDRVGLVCPGSRPATPAAVARSVRIIQEMELVPLVGEHVLSVHGFMAGTDAQRLQDFHRFLEDPSVPAIMCITGGYGALHLLPRINYDAVSANPTLIVGCDDNTILLNALHARTGLVTLHAPNLDQIKNQKTFKRVQSALMNSGHLPPLDAFAADGERLPAAAEYYCAVDGIVEGKTLGGNLTAFTSLLGTEFMPDVRGGILLLEDINEQNGILDRWITSLYLSGDLQYANAVACGSFENCGITDSYNMLSVMDTFADRMKYLGKTACFGLPFGQHDDTAVVAIGVHARLDAGAGRLDFLESAVNH